MSDKPNVSMLGLALRKIKAAKPAEASDESAEVTDELEQAMDDFQNATSKSERAAAFRAALELAK